MKDKLIIFFTRIPREGRTKTRLEPFMSKSQCVEIQIAFIKDIYKTISCMGIDIVVAYSNDGDLNELKELVNDDLIFVRQEGSSLGEKMHRTISYGLESYKKVVLIGSDIPLLSQDDLKRAFEILEKRDIVIAPTYDGGYYLIGMKEENREIFEMKYGNSSVFEETVKRIEKIGKSYDKGNIQLDIDDREDFLSLYKILKEDESISSSNTREFVYKFMERYDKYEQD